MYKIDGEKLDRRPELRLGDRIYSVDNRLSTFRKISLMLSENEELGQRNDEFEVVVGQALGACAYDEILAMDLPFAAMQELVIIILAAIQDLTPEEARRRFRGTGGGQVV